MFFKAKPKKCKLFQRKVTFLGEVVFGFVSYCRRFVKDFADVANPLVELTR